MTTPRRWELSAEELQQVAAARSGSLSPRMMVVLMARNPRLAAEVVRVLMEALRAGLFGNNSLTSLFGAERARRAIPDAATGVGWFDERPFLEVLTPLLNDGTRALELGCGAGRISRHAAPLVADLVCTDASPAMITEARENLREFTNVRASCTDGYALPEFGDEQFDVVFGQGVLGYLPPNQVLGLLHEIRRVLRPGGVSVFNFFTIDDPEHARRHLSVVLTQARRRRPHGGIAQAYTRAQLYTMHAVAGLEPASGGASDATAGSAPERIVITGTRPAA